MSPKPESRKPPHIDLREWARQVPLRGTTKCALLGLVMHCDAKGVCWPSIKTLSNTIGLSCTTVKTGIRELQQGGLITVTHRNRGKTGRQSNLYQLNFTKGYGREPSLPGAGADPTYGREPSLEVTLEVTKKNPPIVPPLGGRRKRPKREPMWKTATRKALDQVNDNTD